MTVRPLKPEDIPQLQAMYEEMGFDYSFPDLLSPEFVDVTVLEDEGRPIMAIASRKTVEAYLFMDKNWGTPAWRQEGFMQVHLAAHKAIKALGFRDAHCWIPPQIVRSFGRRLERVFGWRKSVWDVFSREL